MLCWISLKEFFSKMYMYQYNLEISHRLDLHVLLFALEITEHDWI